MSISMRRGVGAIASQPLVSPSIMTPIIYVGNGTTQSITGANFLPDLVWIKNRDATDFHVLTDSTRGVTKYIRTDSSAIEVTDANSLTSFDSDGFSIGTQNEINTNTENFVAWCFKKDIEAFDIVAYTGTGSGHTEAHSMTVTPEMIFVKNLDQTDNWAIFHKNLNSSTSPEDEYLPLNTAGAEINDVTVWNSTAPTSSVFSVGSNTLTNASGEDHIAYLFASKAGVSKVNTYSGTGSSGNSITGLGFEPRYVLIKGRTSGQPWVVYDAARGDSKNMTPDSTATELTIGFAFDSDGFTLNTTSARTNTSGTNNYIYLALA